MNSFQDRADNFVASHREWMKNAIKPCGHHEMYTRRSTGECVPCTLEAGFVSAEEALELAYPQVEWNTFNSFIGVNGEVRYQEGRTDCTVARVTVDGRVVFGPTENPTAAYRVFVDRYAAHRNGTEDLQYTRSY